MANEFRSESFTMNGCLSFVSKDIKKEDIKMQITGIDDNEMSLFNFVANKCANEIIKDAPTGDYLKPFEKGWKRELVARTISHSKTTRQSDVYYITPSGKRLRSRKEVELFLTDTKLCIEDFLFHKRLIGVNNPNWEIFRYAQPKRKRCDLDIDPASVAEQKHPELLKKNLSRCLSVAKYEDEIDGIKPIVKEFTVNNAPEIITVTSSGRKGRRPKHLEDYKTNIVPRAPKTKNHNEVNVNNEPTITSTVSLNNEPTTSSSNGRNLCVDVTEEHYSISSMQNLNDFRKIEISSSLQSSFSVVSDLTPLSTLTSLASLKLTSVKNLNLLNVEILGNLINLEYLCLGYCNNLPSSFSTEVLTCLKKLQTLRLEGGRDTCVLNILSTVSRLPTLQQLELLFFDIPPEFGKAMAACRNIKKFLLIPIYESNAHSITQWILKALFDWQQLENFTFVITESIIKVAKEFNAMHGLNIDDSVPILESVSALCVNNISLRTLKAKSPLRRTFIPTPLRVEFITVSRLQFLFSKILVDGRASIVTVPDSEIWNTHLQNEE